MKVKQLQNRYNDPSMNRAFIVGVDRAKMRLYDVENNAQNIVDANQTKENYPKPEQAYDKFSEFKLQEYIMANFKTFTNASAPFEGKKIAIDMDRIACFFEDVLKADEGKHTTIWSKDNTWTVQESYDKVLEILEKK